VEEEEEASQRMARHGSSSTRNVNNNDKVKKEPFGDIWRESECGNSSSGIKETRTARWEKIVTIICLYE